MENHELEFKIPNDLLAEIKSIFPSDDPLDAIDFDEVEYINKLFPTEQSLVNIDDVITKFEEDINIRQNLHTQIENEKLALSTLQNTKSQISDLSTRILEINERAESSENMVNEITQDIRQLDIAKRNLTLSITTLNNLHMLVEGVENLEKLIPQRKYSEISNLLQGVLHVIESFQDCMNIPHVKELSDKIHKMRNDLGQQVFTDFKNTLTGHGARVLSTSTDFFNAARLIDIMEPSLKKEFIDWFIGLQLAEYNVLFQESQEEAWLDKIDKRFTWFKRFANDYTEKYYGVFPDSWELINKMALQFCHDTRAHLSRAMSRRYQEIDVKLLLFAFQKTKAFEELLAEKFVFINPSEEQTDKDMKRVSQTKKLVAEDMNPFAEKPSNSTNPFEENAKESNQNKIGATSNGETVTMLSPFIGSISSCFHEYLNIFIKAQDRNLKDMLDRFVIETKTIVIELNAYYNNVSPFSGDQDVPAISKMIVLPSSADLFVFFKSVLIQCAQLDNVTCLVHLASDVFKPNLKNYAYSILAANMPNLHSSQNLLSSATATNLRELTSSFLKEGTATAKSSYLLRGDIALICILIGTAEYCCETIKQLEIKLGEKIQGAKNISTADVNYKQSVDFSEEMDYYQNIMGNCISMLSQDLESQCDPYLNAMSKTNWNTLSSVGDQSKHISAISNNFRVAIPFIRDRLTNSRKYFTQFCIKFANSFIPKYIVSLYKCKPVGMVGAEQLLLDTHSLKTILLDLPILGMGQPTSTSANIMHGGSSLATVKKAPPVNYVKIVNKGMIKAELILKIVMTPHSQDSTQNFVENCLKLLPELDGSEFQKIMEMKGIKRSEQQPIMELFKSLKQPSSVPETDKGNA